MAEKKNSVGAIWRKKTRNGSEFLSIFIDGKRYVAWQNTFRQKDTEPDFRIYEDDYKSPQAAANKPVQKESIAEDSSDDLPF